MEKVISLLFDIERKANQIIERANDEKNELFEENEKAIAQMEAEIAAENNAKIKLIMEEAEKELEAEKQKLIQSCNKQLSDLEINFKSNREALATKIFESIIHY